MFGSIKKALNIGHCRASVQKMAATLEDTRRTISMLGDEELANGIYEEGMSQLNEQYNNYMYYSNNQHVVSAAQVKQMLAMSKEAEKRSVIMLEMLKTQGLSVIKG